MLLFVDGFDHYTTADIGLKWSAATNGDTGADYGIQFIDMGGDGGCLALGGAANTVRKDLAGVPTLVLGTGINYTDAPLDTDNFFLQLLGSDAPQLVFTLAPDGSIQVYRKSAVSGGDNILVGASAAGVLPPATYCYLEVRATISAASAGALEVRVDGATVLHVHGVRTNATGSSVEQITGVLLGNGAGAASGGTTYFDNLYICDTNGAANNDFLGVVQVSTTIPNADGSYREFTPKTGQTHFTQVNGAQPNTYVASSVVGARDTYQFLDVVGLDPDAVVCGVQITDTSLTDVAGARSIAHLSKSGISEQASGAMALSLSRAFHRSIQETDPATGTGWTLDGVNAAEFGVVVAA